MARVKGGVDVLNAMSGLGKPVNKKFPAPKGFPRAYEPFFYFGKWCSSSWFDGIESEEMYLDKARVWEARLTRFPIGVIKFVVAELMEQGCFKAYELHSFVGLCEVASDKTVKRCGYKSPASRSAHEEYKRKRAIQRQGVIDGR